jgi:hypothetical protein
MLHARLSHLFLRAISAGVVVGAGGLALVLASPSADASSKHSVNPCTLLSKSQLGSVLEGSVGGPVRGPSMCTFKTPGSNGQPGNFVEVFTFPSTSSSYFKGQYMTAQTRSEGFKSVPGIGSLAVIHGTGNEIDFLKDNTLVTIDVDERGSNGLAAPIAPSTLEFLGRQAAAKVK